MHDWLPCLAAIGIGVPVAVHCRWGGLMAAFFCGGLHALIRYFGG